MTSTQRLANRMEPYEAEMILAEYLRRRLWPSEMAAELDLRVVIDRRGDLRIRHPFRHRGERVGWQARAVDDDVEPRWLSSSGPIRCPYESDRLEWAREVGWVIVTEGISDAVSLIAAFDSVPVVGIPGASGFKASWLPAFSGLSVFVVGDNDPSGLKFREKVDGLLSPVSTLHQVLVSKPYNDVTEWLARIGDLGVFGAEFDAACAFAAASADD
jgi:hypothetical protein